MRNHDTWMVVFDTTTCHIYHYDKHHLDLLKEIKHIENRGKDSDFALDRPGHYKASNARGAYTPKSNHKANSIQHFANEIGHYLEKERSRQHYDKLILVAEPHMMGRMKKHISKNVERLVHHEVPKSLLWTNDNALLSRVNQHMYHH